MYKDGICFLGAAELARRIRRRLISPNDVLSAFREQIEFLNPALNAIVTFNEAACDEAEKASAEILAGRVRGPLHGVPFTVKDAYDTAGIRTTSGSLLFGDNVPQADATIVARLRAAGAILVGKTNLPEFCLGVETENRLFGRTLNPWGAERTPGGSSGGEAAAISAGMSALGVGSDQGGSLRLPAHYCGIVGFKPTLGRIPVTGHRPDTLHQFATAGLMGRYVEDVRLGLSVAQGADHWDWYSQVPMRSTMATDFGKLRIGYVVGDTFGPLQPEISGAVLEVAGQLRGFVRSVSEVPVDSVLNIDCDILSEGLYRAEGERFLSKVIEGKENLLHPWIGKELGRATRELSDYLDAAARVEHLRREVQALFGQFDVLVCPVAPIVAPVFGRDHIVVNGEQRRLRSVNRALQPFNLCGNPAISVPYCLSSDGMPIGIQIVGDKYQEETVLGVAERLEALRPLGYTLPLPHGVVQE